MVAPVPAQSSKPPPPVLPNRGRPQDKDYPTSRPQPKDLLPRPQSSQNSALKFTIDKRPDLGYHFVCYLKQTRRIAPPLTPLDSALTRNVEFCTILVQISPLESALTDIPLLTPLESALTKIPGVGTPTLPRHTSLPLSYAPRGASIPCGLSRLRILPVTMGVYESVWQLGWTLPLYWRERRSAGWPIFWSTTRSKLTCCHRQ